MHIFISKLIRILFKTAMSISDLENKLNKKISILLKKFNDVSNITFSPINNYSELEVNIWFTKTQSIYVKMKYENMDFINTCKYSFDLNDSNDIEDRISIETKQIVAQLSDIYKVFLQKQGKQFLN